MKDFRQDSRFRSSFGTPDDTEMFFDGTDIGQLIQGLKELGPLRKPQTTPMPVGNLQQSVDQMSFKAPSDTQAPMTAPEPPQVQETPQVSPTSETAPEAPQAPTKDPVTSLDSMTVKDAPPEVFK